MGAPLLVLLLLLMGVAGVIVMTGLSDDGGASMPDMLDGAEHSRAELDGAGDAEKADPEAGLDRPAVAHPWQLRVSVESAASLALRAEHDALPLEGVVVVAHLVRPGIRKVLARGTTDESGVVEFDVSALDLVPAVLRALSQIHVDAQLEGWYIAGESSLEAHGHPRVLGLRAWPEDKQRSLATTLHLSRSPAVRGRAVDAGGAPVADAGVRINDQERETVTRADGTFVLPVDKAREASVEVVEPRTGHFRSEPLDLDPSTPVALGDVTLRRATALLGRVVDTRGKPIPGLPLEITRLSMWVNRWTLGSVHYEPRDRLKASTRVDGTFRMPAEEWMTERDGPLHTLAWLGVRGFAWPTLNWSLETVNDAHHKQQPIVLAHHRVRGRLLLPDGTPLPGGQVTLRLWNDAAALRAHPDRPDGKGGALASGADARFALFLKPGSVARLYPYVRHATGEMVEVVAPLEGPPRDLRVVVTPTSGETGATLVVRGDAPVTQLFCRVRDDRGRDVFFNETDSDRLRLPLAPGRYSLQLQSRDTRVLEGHEGRWGRYRGASVDIAVPKVGFASVVHDFELKAFVEVTPEIIGLPDAGVLPEGTKHLRLWARLRLTGDEKDQVSWDYSWWQPGKSIGGPRSAVPGTYDLVVGGPAVQTATVPLVVEAGEFLRPHVRLEWKR